MLADKTNYHVVQLSDEYAVPTVLASPAAADAEVKDEPVKAFDLLTHYMPGEFALRCHSYPK